MVAAPILGTIGLKHNLWFFNSSKDTVIGIWFWGVSLEDFIFVLVVPTLVIASYEFFKKLLGKRLGQ